MNTEIDSHKTVGQLVTERPDRSRVFETLKIDYCCGGKLPLAEACAKRGLDASGVIDLLQQADAAADEDAGSAVDPDSLSLTGLADHIEREHHAYLRTELPRLDAMTDKVCRVHGEREPRLGEVRRAFCALRDELTTHMMKEERILFPIVRQLEQAEELPSSHCGSIANPIRQMEAEHDAAGDALAIIRAATDDYQPPDWACNTYRAMLVGLAQLEQDMHQHIHKENNVLFPKAITLEQHFASRAQGHLDARRASLSPADANWVLSMNGCFTVAEYLVPEATTRDNYRTWSPLRRPTGRDERCRRPSQSAGRSSDREVTT